MICIMRVDNVYNTWIILIATLATKTVYGHAQIRKTFKGIDIIIGKPPRKLQTHNNKKLFYILSYKGNILLNTAGMH